MFHEQDVSIFSVGMFEYYYYYYLHNVPLSNRLNTTHCDLDPLNTLAK